MDTHDIEIIEKEIIPALENGRIMLFLGAGFSVGTPSIASKIPSSQELIHLICQQIHLEDYHDIDLQDAFQLGNLKINDFEKFLVDIFTVKTPFSWQIDIFRYWWRSIFTTNIDTVIEESIKILDTCQLNIHPDYKIYCHKDVKPIQMSGVERSIVKLHGSITRPNDGFIFERASYAMNSIERYDWMHDVAANIEAGNCLFLGSRFKEIDIDIEISKRSKIYKNSHKPNSWIVLNHFAEYEKELYNAQHITPITATIEEFIKYLTNRVRPLSQKSYIKKHLPHLHISEQDPSPNKWFLKSFSSIQSLLNLEESYVKGKFFDGDMIDWKYIRDNVPAELSYCNTIIDSVNKYIESSEKGIFLINIIGAVCCGKTTAAMQALKKLSLVHNNIYYFNSEEGIDIEFFWKTIKDLKGVSIFYFDNGYEHYYAIDEIIKRFYEIGGSQKIIFLTESRIVKFTYHKRHFKSIDYSMMKNIEISQLNRDDARLIIEKINQLGITYEKFKDISDVEKVDMLISKTTGYAGDLFAAFYDLSSSKSYEKRIEDEFIEIENQDALYLYTVLLLSSVIRINFPLTYLSEICRFSVYKVVDICNTELKGKIKRFERPLMQEERYSARHISLASYIIKNLINKEHLQKIIIEILSTVGKKFTIKDIKLHPLPFRIYKEIISYKFITDIFKSEHITYIEKIYSHAEILFNMDAFFWLQYGRFLDKQKKYEDAIYCFRRGLSLHETPHLLHALGHVLIKKYIDEGFFNIEEKDEGISLLYAHFLQYGKTDSYFATTLLDMISQIISENKDNELTEKGIAVANQSSDYINNKEYNRALQRFLEAKKSNF